MLRIKDFMAREVTTFEPDAGAAEAWSICRDNNIRHPPIYDGKRLVGLVPDRDPRNVGAPRRAHIAEDALTWVRMRDIMSMKLITFSPSDTLERPPLTSIPLSKNCRGKGDVYSG